MSAADLSFDEAESSSDLSRAYLACRELAAESVAELGGVELMRAYSDLTDALVARIYEIASEGPPPDDLAVAAVGGYSYRRMDDVENLPLETQTALLDARRVIGSAAPSRHPSRLPPRLQPVLPSSVLSLLWCFRDGAFRCR